MEELERRKQEILEKFRQGTCTPEEKSLLDYIYNLSAASAEDREIADEEQIGKEIWASLPHRQAEERSRLRIIRFRTLSAAAAILIILSVGLIFYQNKLDTPSTSSPGSEIIPGTNGATLTLSNGKKIRLSDAMNGELAQESGVRVIKTEDGSLVYEVIDQKNGQITNNTLSTSKGETYSVKLPDGTMIWLNAASTIQYPSSFANSKKRLVQLKGEAYLEVAQDKSKPFIVRTDRQDVKVLGTHFNVHAYANEQDVETTLLEGSVEVSAGSKVERIRPGQQLVLSENGEMDIHAVETQLSVAWKNNEFMFDNEGIERVMNAIARWYNVDVIYQGAKPNDRFGGTISRLDHVEAVLNMLQKTGGVRFDIQGRTIYVSK